MKEKTQRLPAYPEDCSLKGHKTFKTKLKKMISLQCKWTKQRSSQKERMIGSLAET